MNIENHCILSSPSLFSSRSVYTIACLVCGCSITLQIWHVYKCSHHLPYPLPRPLPQINIPHPKPLSSEYHHHSPSFSKQKAENHPGVFSFMFPIKQTGKSWLISRFISFSLFPLPLSYFRPLSFSNLNDDNTLLNDCPVEVLPHPTRLIQGFL